MVKCSSIHLIKWSNITSNRTSANHVCPAKQEKKMRRREYHFSDIPTKGAYCKPNNEETADKPRSRNVLQNNWSVLLQEYQSHDSQRKTKELS